MKDYLVIFTFIIVHILLGRKISIPYGIAFGMNPLLVGTEAFILDILQIPFFYYLYESSTRISIIADLKRWSEEKQKGMEKGFLFKFLKNTGRVGIVIISASPLQGGGMWSGVLMTFLMNHPKRESYLLLIAGSLLGCAVLVAGFNIIIEWIRSLL